MTTQRIAELLNAKPFQPFDMRIADGETVRVLSPEFVGRSPSGRTMVVFTEDDRMKIIDVFMITSLETGNGRQAGRGRKRK